MAEFAGLKLPVSLRQVGTMLVRIAILALLLASLFVDTDEKIATEFVRGTCFYIFLIFAAKFFLRLLGKNELSNKLRIDMQTLALLIFAMVSTVHAISYIVDTEIPRLKTIFRMIYTFYLFFATSPYARRMNRDTLVLVTALLFSSFLFHWMFVVGSLRTVPLLLFTAYFWVDRAPSVSNWFNRRDPFFLMIAMALISFTVANLWNNNYLNGAEGVFRMMAGVFLFSLVRRAKESEDSSRMARILTLLAGLHAVIILVSIVSVAVTEGSAGMLGKRTAYAGVNANDISGYLVTVFPLAFALIWAPGSSARRLAAAFLFVVCLVILVLVKSRAAFPVVALSLTAFAFALRGSPRSDRGDARPTVLWVLGSAAVLITFVIVILAVNSRALGYLADLKTLDIRVDLWRAAARAIAGSPFVGVGSENYIVLASQRMSGSADLESFAVLAQFMLGGAYVHCHNLFMQLWLDGGIFYLVSLAGLCILAIKRAFRTSRTGADRVFDLAAGVSLLATLMQGLMNYHFINHSTWLTVWLLLGVAARIPQPEEKTSEAKFPWITVGGLVAAVLISVHMYALNNRAAALKTLRPISLKNAYYAYVFEGTDADASLVTAAWPAISKSMSVYRKSPELNQLAGEAQFYLASHGKKDAYASAMSYYQSCLANAPNSPFCAKRIGDIMLAMDPASKEAQEMYTRSRELDPFDLLTKAKLRKL